MNNRGIPCTIMRGGTSKGLYFMQSDLPTKEIERDKCLLRVMGSPDMKQIDGLGGGSSVTSKVAIISPSERDGVDVDYLFAQVSVDTSFVSYAGNCGNISAGVGPFAIENGLVKSGCETTIVNIYNCNTGKMIRETIKTPNGVVTYDGNYEIRGVPGGAAPIRLDFISPAGSIFDSILPTGNPIDIISVDYNTNLEISIVDSSNPIVFVRAEDVGMTGCELPDKINNNPDLLAKLELIRGLAAKKLGLVKEAQEATTLSPGIPKLTVVSSPKTYVTAENQTLSSSEYDILARMTSMSKPHPTYAMTGAMCTASAASIEGTLVNQITKLAPPGGVIRIGHPGGVLEAGVELEQHNNGELEIKSAYGYRTARKLMTGIVFS